MTRRQCRPQSTYTDAYPSLSEHCQSRRSFLRTGLVLAGGGALAAGTAGCPWLTPGIDGDVAAPSWSRIRFPVEPSSESAYLLDDGYAEFVAIAVTYNEDVGMFAQDHHSALLVRLVSDLSLFTYDELRSTAGPSAAADAMLRTLNEAYNEENGETGDAWFEWLELTITRLEEPYTLAGVDAEPSYP